MKIIIITHIISPVVDLKKHHGCPAMGLIWLRCKNPNHLTVACCHAGQTSKIVVKLAGDSSVSVDTLFFINSIDNKRAWYKSIKLEGINIKVKLDTGSEVIWYCTI